MARVERLEPRRLLATLTPDAAWADDGYLGRVTDSTFVASTRAGVLVIEGPDIGTGYLTRYAVDGTRDRGFRDVPLSETAEFVADARGRIYVNDAATQDGRPLLVRYDVDGRPDAAWAGGGGVPLDIPAIDYDVRRVMLTADGSVFVQVTYDDSVYDAGDYLYGGRHDQVFKFSDRGVADTAFGDNGVIDFSSENAADVDFVWTGVQSDGHVVLVQVGHGAGAFVTRYRPNGKIDKAYRQRAAASPVAGELTEDSIALDPRDRLTLAELLRVPRPGTKKTDYSYVVRRYSADGRPDKAFGTAGVATVAAATADGFAGTVLPQQNGKLIVQFGEQVFRLRLGGERDTSSDPVGVADLRDGAAGLFGIVGQLPDGSLLATAVISQPSTDVQTVAKLAPGVPAAQGKSGTLYLYGTDGGDLLNVYSAGKGVGTAVDLGGQRLGVFKGVTAVVADLSDGDDAYIDEFNDVPQTVLGGDGDDSITTADGDDSVRGGGGTDRIATAGGDDLVYAGDGDDLITTSAGDDRVYAEGGDDTVRSGDGYDRLDLGPGNGTVDAGSGGGEIGLVPLKTERVVVRGAGGDWSLGCYGGSADIVLTGRTADLYFGSNRGSTIDVRMTDGATIHAGQGNDSITTGDGDDLITPGAGNDTVASGAGDDTVGGEDRYDDPGYGAADLYDLGAGNDLGVDDYGDNTILGGSGNDSLKSSLGDDSLSGGIGRDTLRAGTGDDTLVGGGGRDRLFGYDGDDLIRGGADDDWLYGGPGDDTLDGGPGDDVLLEDDEPV